MKGVHVGERHGEACREWCLQCMWKLRGIDDPSRARKELTIEMRVREKGGAKSAEVREGEEEWMEQAMDVEND